MLGDSLVKLLALLLRCGLGGARVPQGPGGLGHRLLGHVFQGLSHIDGMREGLVLRNAVQPELVQQLLELRANVLGLPGELALGVLLAHGLLAALLAERLGGLLGRPGVLGLPLQVFLALGQVADPEAQGHELSPQARGHRLGRDDPQAVLLAFGGVRPAAVPPEVIDGYAAVEHLVADVEFRLDVPQVPAPHRRQGQRADLASLFDRPHCRQAHGALLLGGASLPAQGDLHYAAIVLHVGLDPDHAAEGHVHDGLGRLDDAHPRRLVLDGHQVKVLAGQTVEAVPANQLVIQRQRLLDLELGPQDAALGLHALDQLFGLRQATRPSLGLHEGEPPPLLVACFAEQEFGPRAALVVDADGLVGEDVQDHL